MGNPSRQCLQPSLRAWDLFRAWFWLASLTVVSFWSLMQPRHAHAAPPAELPVYSVHVEPQFQPMEIHRTWGPLLARLGQEMGVRFELKTPKDLPAFESEFKAGTPDFAYMNPYHAASGGIRATLDREPEEVRQQLRVLFETPAVPSHPLSAHPRVAPAVRLALQKAMERLSQDDAGKALLRGMLMPRPVKADYGRDYQPLERLQLERYVE